MKIYSNLITWSPSYSVGIKIIDDQHKELLKLVNEMYNHVVGNEEAERDYFKKIIQQTIEYIRINFATEEKILQAAKFPGYLEHKSAHETLILTLIGNMREVEIGKKLNLTAFTRFLRDWILTHIAIMDRQDFASLKKSINKLNKKQKIAF